VRRARHSPSHLRAWATTPPAEIGISGRPLAALIQQRIRHWQDPKNWSTFLRESILFVRAMAAYPARGWSTGSVSVVEFDGQGGGPSDSDDGLPGGRCGGVVVMDHISPDGVSWSCSNCVTIFTRTI
jgi:hypothetical protein